jgi:hypothetical protein
MHIMKQTFVGVPDAGQPAVHIPLESFHNTLMQRLTLWTEDAKMV